MRRAGVIVGLLLATHGTALEFQTSTDISAQITGYGYPQQGNVPAMFQGPDYVVNGQLSADWNVRALLSDSLEFDVRYGLAALSELDQSGSEVADSTAAAYRIDDLPSSLDPAYQQQLDRLNLRWYSPFGDYVIGRQAISFGQARVFSPIDIIQPSDLTRLDSSYRAGVDALRATWLLGAVSEFDTGLVIGETRVAFARLKAFLFSTDWELIALTINDDHRIYSLGTTAAVGTLGLWQESAWLDGPDRDGLRATVGADYMLFDDLYVFAELHYNGLGDDADYQAVLSESFYQLGAVQPWGQWYVTTQAQYPLNVLTQLGVGTTVNLVDGSALVNGRVSYNATQTLTVNLNAAIPLSTEVGTDAEYSLYPRTIGIALNWTF